ncbi:MAG TPA: hypothetical protein VFZ36_12405, partial [Vicinamibacterales bacterium]
MVVLALVFAGVQDVTPLDLEIINAAIDHKARKAIRTPGLPILLRDRSMSVCETERAAVACIPVALRNQELRKRMPELTNDRLDSLAARNRKARVLRSPSPDVVVIADDELRKLPDRRAVRVSVSTSLPVLIDEKTALVYLGYSCGGRCGEG